jgi:hypothetical protein
VSNRLAKVRQTSRCELLVPVVITAEAQVFLIHMSFRESKVFVDFYSYIYDEPRVDEEALVVGDIKVNTEFADIDNNFTLSDYQRTQKQNLIELLVPFASSIIERLGYSITTDIGELK